MALTLCASALSAHAAYAPPVTLTETPHYFQNGYWHFTEYTISNNLEQGLDIVAFGVTNPQQYIQTSTDYKSWSSRHISKTEWDSGLTLERYCDQGDDQGPSVCGAFETGVGDPSIEYGDPRMGLFEDLFGITENYVNFYWFNGLVETSDYIWAGESKGGFNFSAPAASEYAVFNKHGEVLYKSASVPEPGVLALTGLGLIGLFASRRGQWRRNTGLKGPGSI